jgi:bifunctional N-acetylglucosamine-1-phosphate-uridyltransferase/glucosamine-1-phosphate-acetyltransferase GlmU-like protein
MKQLLVIPAAGTGSRLGRSIPKPLVKVGDHHIVDFVTEAWPKADVALVIHPQFDELWRKSVKANYFLFQESPRGMGDAVAQSLSLWSDYEQIIVAWGDTVWLNKKLVDQIQKAYQSLGPRSFLVPAMDTDQAYISLQLNAEGSVEKVLERREGDGEQMQGRCLSDLGVFVFSSQLAFEFQNYLADPRLGIGRATGEKNFLAFMSYLSSQGVRVQAQRLQIDTPIVGINTPEELHVFEQYVKGSFCL